MPFHSCSAHAKSQENVTWVISDVHNASFTLGWVHESSSGYTQHYPSHCYTTALYHVAHAELGKVVEVRGGGFFTAELYTAFISKIPAKCVFFLFDQEER